MEPGQSRSTGAMAQGLSHLEFKAIALTADGATDYEGRIADDYPDAVAALKEEWTGDNQIEVKVREVVEGPWQTARVVVDG